MSSISSAGSFPALLPGSLPWGVSSTSGGGGAVGSLTGVYAMIGGQQVTVVHGSVRGDSAVAQRSALEFVVVDPDGAYAFLEGQPVILYGSDGSVLMRRWIATSQRARTTGGNLLEHTITCTDNHYLADKRLFASTYANQTAQYIVNDILTNVLASEGVSAGVIGGASITIGAFTSNYATVAACLDAICQKAQGYTWWIDDARRLYFQTSNPTPAPVTISDVLIERDTEQVTHGNPLYRNTQYMLGGVAETAQQTETRIGDGHTTAFILGYEMSATAPTITLNGTSQTVGVLNKDTGKQWYYQQGSNTITQDSSGTVLTSTDTLQVVYIGQWPQVSISQDSAAVSARQTREGGDTSGIVEAAATDTTLTTTTDAFAAASGYLARYAQDSDTLTFVTQQSGFAQGQLATVNIPAYGLSNEQMLIESVTLSDVGPAGSEVGVLYYTVKAVKGPLNTSWVQFFGALASQQQTFIDSINVGSSSSVAILQSGTAAWTWTVTGSATVNSLLIPSSTLYPSATLYPGTAGAPVAITWTKTDAALNALRDVLSGAGSSLAVGYFAWGTGTQATPASATQLAAEAGRKQVTSITTTSTPGEELINGYLGPSDAVGVAITEVAFFAGPYANSSANSGVMLLYGLYSHTHTASESIQVQADSTIS